MAATAAASARSPRSTSSRRRPRPKPLRPVISRCPTPVAPASLRLRHEVPEDTARAGALLLRAPSGELLLEAYVPPSALSDARASWRRRVASAVIIACGVTLLLLVGPLLDQPLARAKTAAFVRATGQAIALVGGRRAADLAGICRLQPWSSADAGHAAARRVSAASIARVAGGARRSAASGTP